MRNLKLAASIVGIKPLLSRQSKIQNNSKKLINYFLRADSGFTLVELIMTISIISLITALAIPVYSSFQVETQLGNTAVEIAQTLRRAQQKAFAGEQDRDWGVSFTSSAYTLYANGDSSFDEEQTLPATLQLSGLSGVEFSRLTGKTSDTGNIIVTAGSIDQNKTVNVNGEGRVQ